jgi:hypothetical protein
MERLFRNTLWNTQNGVAGTYFAALSSTGLHLRQIQFYSHGYRPTTTLTKLTDRNNTESYGRVVNTPASFSEVPAFKSRHRDRLYWLRCLRFSSVPPGNWLDNNSKLGYDASFHILSSSSFTYHSFIRRFLV